MPLVLTLIPAFNAARTVGDAVRSALDQAGVEARVLLCDDASTDDTAACLEQLRQAAPQQVHVLHNPDNLGPGRTRNRMLDFIRATRGTGFLAGFGPDDYLAFLDADDLCLPRRFVRQIEYLQQHPACRMVGGQLISFGPRQADQRIAFPGDPDEIRVQSLFETVNLPSTYFCRLAEVDRPEFHFVDLAHGEDWEFFIRNQRWLNYANLAVPVCRYRRHDSNATANLADALDSIATRLRTAYLKSALGITPSPEEIKLHITISPCKFWRLEEQAYFWRHRPHILGACDRWLTRLAQANRKTGFVSGAAFDTVATGIRQNLETALLAAMPEKFRFDLEEANPA